MRKRKGSFKLLVLLCGFLLIFTSCSQKNKKPEDIFAGHTGNYSTSAKIAYKELKATARISRETPVSCSVVFESPESLKDMAFVFQRDSVDLNYKGLSFNFEQDSLPATAVAKIAVSAINRAMRDDGLSVALDGGVLEITGMLESGEFILRVNGETGSLMKLLVPAEELEIEFENFTFLD